MSASATALKLRCPPLLPLGILRELREVREVREVREELVWEQGCSADGCLLSADG
jgi:hypothetical protein